MSLYEKYELLEPVHDDGIKTFRGRENATGRFVEIHLFVGLPGKTEPPLELFAEVKRLSPRDCTRLLEYGEHLGTPFVVTLPLEGFQNFREWLATQKPAPAPPKPAYDPLSRVGRWKIPVSPPPAQPSQEAPRSTPPVSSTPSSEGGPFAAPPPAPRGKDPSADLLQAQARPQQPQQPETQPGEFTRLFQSPAPAPEPVGATPSPAMPPVGGEFANEKKDLPLAAGGFPAPASHSVKGEMEGGEFTRLFRAPGSPLPALAAGESAAIPSPPETLAPAADAGEFTRLFVAPGSNPQTTGSNLPPPPATPPPVDQPQALAAPPAVEAGEFTRLFATPPPAAPSSGLPGFGAGAPASHSVPETSAVSRLEAAGEFTRMFSNFCPPAPSPSMVPPVTTPASTPLTGPPSPSPPTTTPPGEFTRLFQTPAAPPSSVSGSQPPPAQPAGEFTRMFQSPPAAPMGEPLFPGATTPAPSSAPGGFPPAAPKQPLPIASPPASVFGGPTLGQPTLPPPPVAFGQHGAPAGPAPQPPHPWSAPAATPPLGQPFFGMPGTTSAPLAAPPASPFQPGPVGAIPQRPYPGPTTPSVQDEYSKLFGPGDRPAASAPPPAPPPLFTASPFASATQSFAVPESQPIASRPEAGPSEYTRLIQRPADSLKPPAAAPAPKPAPAAKPQPKWPLIVFGVLFLILIVVGIFLFAK
ncbi:MAG: hypothetical protein NZV14_18875 [Bryobacteraceae bacterium]|nr:hypothetical protein [Bryobacteraceae bacterium]MDW8380229.1 hypothetical protein [Bryobacterales bacterium]